jgi:mycofactocin system glycosyltransferase
VNGPRFELDVTWQRFGRTIVAGSPLRLFRLSPAGIRVAERIECGDELTAHVDGTSWTPETRLIDRLLDAGAIHPLSPTDRPARLTLADVTVVTPQLGGEVRHDGRLTIDDGSTPQLTGAAVRLDRTGGPAAARNAARPLVDTELVAFIDADVIIDGDVRSWIAPLLWHFDDPKVGLVAPLVRGEAGSPLDLGDQPARIRAGTRVSYVPAAAIVVRTEALGQTGWFDETLRFGEDVDLVWRLDEAGWRCRFDPSVWVWHEPRSTWRARLRQHAGYGTSAAPLALRHPGALSPLHVNGWTAAAWLLVLTGRRATALGAVVLVIGSSAALVRKLPDVAPTASFTLALRGHLLAGQQIAAAVRRVWWPIVGVAALGSRRMRVVAAAAVLADVRSTPDDIAYGWGVWTSMRRLRTWAPIVPRLNAWPGRPPRRPRDAAVR